MVAQFTVKPPVQPPNPIKRAAEAVCTVARNVLPTVSEGDIELEEFVAGNGGHVPAEETDREGVTQAEEPEDET